MVVAFTPTVGIQMPLALALATLVNANRPVSIVPTWLTNPLTLGPVYLFDYTVGRRFWSGPPLREVSAQLQTIGSELAGLDAWAIREALGRSLALGVDVFVPMLIGGLIVGGVAGLVSYPLTIRGVGALRTRHQLRRRRRAERRRRRRIEQTSDLRDRDAARAAADTAAPDLAAGERPAPRQ